jgi:hypothetical protein
LALEDDECALPSRRTIYLNRDFLKAGQNRVTINDITPFTVFMWDNRYERDLSYNRDNMAPVTNEYREQTLGQVDYFRRQLWSMVNLETKQMLTNEVRKAFQETNFNMIMKWNDGIKMLNQHTRKSENSNVAYACCYGEAFSGNWAKNGQAILMRRINVEWRKWDIADKPCPNGFISHMYSATKGHHVKRVDNVSAKLGREANGKALSRNRFIVPETVRHLPRDPNFLDAREIYSKLTEFVQEGNLNPSINQFKQMLFNMRKSNLHVCKKISLTTIRAASVTTDEDDDGKMPAVDSVVVDRNENIAATADDSVFTENDADSHMDPFSPGRSDYYQNVGDIEDSNIFVPEVRKPHESLFFTSCVPHLYFSISAMTIFSGLTQKSNNLRKQK